MAEAAAAASDAATPAANSQCDWKPILSDTNINEKMLPTLE